MAPAQQLNGGAAAAAVAQHAKLWSDPGDIRSRDLFFGPGSKEREPHGPVKFVKEDKKGNSPKFDVTDASGKQWRAKLGLEVQPEVVATRLMWAVGYTANENYYVSDLMVENLPDHLSRGREFVSRDGHVRSVRLQIQPKSGKKGIKKGADWEWRHNPFVGTREFNGLRVMMALISNWDLKTDNNGIHGDKNGEELYEVSDVGSSFGRMGKSYTDARSKNNLPAYRKSKFISKFSSEYVDFNFPTHPPLLYIFNLPMFWNYAHIRWVGHHIPRNDVKWIGSLLSQLTPQQIRDAFRAAGYTPEQVEAYSTALQARIDSLLRL